MIDDLYSAKILKLVANIPRAGRLGAPDASSEKVSKLCGSKITVDIKLEAGRVSDFAQDVKACALGQAAAAILGAAVIGATPEEIEVARTALHAMLKAGGAPPDGRFSELAILSAVKDYPARHASTMLAFEAASEAARAATQAATSRTSRAGAA
ncbi:MAG TPA: iron-sulfur cluster assembly scaffold protein [Caulobacteraceae bacterium]|nr:iron-sulfur cluster assembly scaffold protein [Caulobacteraceae bacterium]